jgi:hypothetical protein
MLNKLHCKEDLVRVVSDQHLLYCHYVLVLALEQCIDLSQCGDRELMFLKALSPQFVSFGVHSLREKSPATRNDSRVR